MTCLRCEGFMVEYDLIDIDVASLRYDQRLTAWRCVNCGAICEAGMGLNRLAKASTNEPAPRPDRSVTVR
jgi:hypothetical protein